MRPFITLLLLALLASCAAPPQKAVPKTKPEFSSTITDPELKTITNAYFRLSARNNIGFKHNVSMGFSHINSGRTIGFCTFRKDFREINLDSDYWQRASWNDKIALVFHEMTHCYCARDHDFGEGEMYPDNTIRALLQEWGSRIPYSPLKPKGYMDDSCPLSIMHPVILSDECFKAHYKYYVKEMFNRCEPF